MFWTDLEASFSNLVNGSAAGRKVVMVASLMKSVQQIKLSLAK